MDKRGTNQESACSYEDVGIALAQQALNEGYAPDLTDAEVQKLGRDPVLIAYVLCDISNRSVTIAEVS